MWPHFHLGGLGDSAVCGVGVRTRRRRTWWACTTRRTSSVGFHYNQLAACSGANPSTTAPASELSLTPSRRQTAHAERRGAVLL